LLVTNRRELAGGKKVIEECKIVPKSLSLVKEKKNKRAGRRERRFENTKAKQNRISLRVREKTAREHASRDERESLFTCLKCVWKVKEFFPQINFFY